MKTLREICFSYIRNSLRKFIGRRGMSRSGEKLRKVYVGAKEEGRFDPNKERKRLKGNYDA